MTRLCEKIIDPWKSDVAVIGFVAAWYWLFTS